MNIPRSAEEDYYESLDAQAEAEQGMAEAEMEADAHEAEESADQLAQAEIDGNECEVHCLDCPPQKQAECEVESTGKNAEPAGAVDEVRTTILQGHPYEISTTVANKTNAKGDFQPEAKIKITRHLETDDEIDVLIRADISRGVEETMEAIDAIHARKR